MKINKMCYLYNSRIEMWYYEFNLVFLLIKENILKVRNFYLILNFVFILIFMLV